MKSIQENEILKSNKWGLGLVGCWKGMEEREERELNKHSDSSVSAMVDFQDNIILGTFAYFYYTHPLNILNKTCPKKCLSFSILPSFLMQLNRNPFMYEKYKRFMET